MVCKDPPPSKKRTFQKWGLGLWASVGYPAIEPMPSPTPEL
ncbi:mCG148309 [Mus musculus]|nr:mCG148309 [Mus musculus]